jgi:glutamine synthetase
MSNIRFKALEITFNRERKVSQNPELKVSSYYGELVFNDKTMQEYLTKDAYNSVKEAICQGKRIGRNMADQIASGMKAWAMDKNVTHYTHWFHPLTGASAEKHDSFADPVQGGLAIERFEGNSLIQQEPDASSFPNGGIRNTFEARGYTAWDPTSPAFILENTLCIPTVFVSYTGEALDYKTPLLKSVSALDEAATKVVKLFNEDVRKVFSNLGWEQEYFLVDIALFKARPDLSLTGRTVFGHSSAKDQQLSDHYFGTIQERALDFMKDLEYEAHRLGIPLKTRHNEVAPNQFECAPVYEEVNIAVDHNQLLMHLLDKVAKRHNLKALLHEKPFEGINGSGKHNNWSISTNTGINLLNPGKNPAENLRFLTILVNVLKAVNDYSDLLRAHIASAGNDHRLGGHEAPPAIISVFIGDQLSRLLKQLENPSEKNTFESKNLKDIDIPKIPEILLDNTDRNRTSPFAFTGNKFEFRAVGSSANCALPMIALNTIVADQFNKFFAEYEILKQKGIEKEEAILRIIRNYIKDVNRIVYEKNNYSQEWLEIAKERGLSNHKTTPEALQILSQDKYKDLFERNNVLVYRELEARYDIKMEKYVQKLQIEARVIGDLALNHIIPTAIKYQNILIENVRGLNQIFTESDFRQNAKHQLDLIQMISKDIEQIKISVQEMRRVKEKLAVIESNPERAFAYQKEVIPFFEKIRLHVDNLERNIDDELWPLPKYREMLFTM